VTTPNTSRTLLRPVADFFFGLMLFVFGASCFAVSDGQASVRLAETGNWVTTVSHATDAPAVLQALSRDWTVLLLALTFAALTAFNLSIARHLRAVAQSPQQTNHIEQ